MSILDTIVKRKHEEVILRKSKTGESSLTKVIAFDRPCISLSNFITSDSRSGIIAEFKRRSPSKPDINLKADVEKVTAGYNASGASALSVLTDVDFFGGADSDLQKARSNNPEIPILRKDFIIDAYQIIEAKSLGADAILLIAEILSKSQIAEFSKIADAIGMEVLMEIHTADQIKKYNDSIRNIGVNNRNLKTFKTDIQYSMDIFPQLPSETIRISESGLDHPFTVQKLKNAGYHGFLIGEHFMKTEDPAGACASFIQQLITAHDH